MAENKQLFSVTLKGYAGHVDILAVDANHAVDMVYNKWSTSYPGVPRKDYNAEPKKL